MRPSSPEFSVCSCKIISIRMSQDIATYLISDVSTIQLKRRRKCRSSPTGYARVHTLCSYKCLCGIEFPADTKALVQGNNSARPLLSGVLITAPRQLRTRSLKCVRLFSFCAFVWIAGLELKFFFIVPLYRTCASLLIMGCYSGRRTSLEYHSVG